MQNYPSPTDEKHYKFLSPRDFYYHDCMDMVEWDVRSAKHKDSLFDEFLGAISFFVVMGLLITCLYLIA